MTTLTTPDAEMTSALKLQGLKQQITIETESSQVHHLITLLINQGISFRVNCPAIEPTQKHRNIMSEPKPTSTQKQQRVSTIISDVYHKYIEGTFEGYPPNIEDIVAEFDISSASFKAYFREQYGKPFYQLYIDKKMERAAELLAQGRKASEISRIMGYSHPIKFNKMFQKRFGITPKKYQMENYTFLNARAK